MTSPTLGFSLTPSDRVRVLLEAFRDEGGFDDGPLDEDAARRFIVDTDAAWRAYRADAARA
jgi:hypothetical protein